MELCGLVILYYPDEKIVERILTYKKALRQLFIIDNSEKTNHHLLNRLQEELDITYLHDGSNEGMAKRLNQAASMALAVGYTWLLTMDQDSYFDDASISAYISCVAAYQNRERVAMFGIEHDQRLLQKGEGCSAIKTTYLITSGSIVNLPLWSAVGGFDEALFIDHVDEEYCFRSLLRGYGIVKFNSFLLHHAIGVPSQHRTFKSLKKTSRSLHSPVRLYYMVRNFLYLRKRYRQHFQKEIKQFRKNLFNRFKNNLLYNEKRVQVFRYILKGLRDFRMNRMGRID